MISDIKKKKKKHFLLLKMKLLCRISSEDCFLCKKKIVMVK